MAYSIADVLELPDAHRHLVNWLLKHGETASDDLARSCGQTDCLAVLEQLVEKGFVQRLDSTTGARYKVHLNSRRQRAPASGVA